MINQERVIIVRAICDCGDPECVDGEVPFVLLRFANGERELTTRVLTALEQFPELNSKWELEANGPTMEYIGYGFAAMLMGQQDGQPEQIELDYLRAKLDEVQRLINEKKELESGLTSKADPEPASPGFEEDPGSDGRSLERRSSEGLRTGDGSRRDGVQDNGARASANN